MFVPMLWPVLVVGAIIFVMMLLLRDGGTRTGRRDRMGLTPFEILRERFARGEIDKAEYEERHRVISQS
jgi:putative membrane protein